MSGGGKHRRHVTAAEAKLWRAATKSFVPLSPERVADDDLVHEPEDVAAAHQVQQSQRATPPRPAASPPGTAKRKPKPGSPLPEFEVQRARRLSRGKLPIEARLDLHGLRQNEAREALLRFLARAQAEGLKHVKVITGKGAAGTNEATSFDMFDLSRRGVLREQVPRWLAEPALRALVVSFTIAGRGHGGEGALYVHVRSKAKH